MGGRGREWVKYKPLLTHLRLYGRKRPLNFGQTLQPNHCKKIGKCCSSNNSTLLKKLNKNAIFRNRKKILKELERMCTPGAKGKGIICEFFRKIN